MQLDTSLMLNSTDCFVIVLIFIINSILSNQLYINLITQYKLKLYCIRHCSTCPFISKYKSVKIEKQQNNTQTTKNSKKHLNITPKYVNIKLSELR